LVRVRYVEDLDRAPRAPVVVRAVELIEPGAEVTDARDAEPARAVGIGAAAGAEPVDARDRPSSRGVAGRVGFRIARVASHRRQGALMEVDARADAPELAGAGTIPPDRVDLKEVAGAVVAGGARQRERHRGPGRLNVVPEPAIAAEPFVVGVEAKRREREARRLRGGRDRVEAGAIEVESDGEVVADERWAVPEEVDRAGRKRRQREQRAAPVRREMRSGQRIHPCPGDAVEVVDEVRVADAVAVVAAGAEVPGDIERNVRIEDRGVVAVLVEDAGLRPAVDSPRPTGPDVIRAVPSEGVEPAVHEIGPPADRSRYGRLRQRDAPGTVVVADDEGLGARPEGSGAIADIGGVPVIADGER